MNGYTTVSELIEELKKVDGDKQIIICDRTHKNMLELDDIRDCTQDNAIFLDVHNPY